MKKNRELKKILFASGTYLPESSGQTTFVRNLSEQFEKTRIETKIVAYSQEKFTSPNLVKIPRDGLRYLQYYRAIKKLSRKTQIVYAQDLISSGFPASLAKRWRRRLVVRIGGDFLWEKMVNDGTSLSLYGQYYDKPKSFRERAYLRIYKYVLRKADGIIFNTLWQKEIYQRHFHLKKKKIIVIENPYYLHIPEVDIPRDNIKIILFAGRLIRVKNIEKLIDAFKRVGDKTIMLKIAGDGPLREKLQQRSVGDSRIVFTNTLSHEQILSEISRCHFLVLPSLSEMHPNIVLEALNVGVPALVTSENGLPASIRDFIHPIDPNSVQSMEEALKYMLDDSNYSKTLAQVKSFHSDYDWQAVAKQHIDFFLTFL